MHTGLVTTKNLEPQTRCYIICRSMLLMVKYRISQFIEKRNRVNKSHSVSAVTYNGRIEKQTNIFICYINDIIVCNSEGGGLLKYLDDMAIDLLFFRLTSRLLLKLETLTSLNCLLGQNRTV